MDASTALVTGASAGIGRALAERLAELGITVALVARREDALLEVKRGIEERGGKAAIVTADLGDPEQAASMVRRAAEQIGDLDLVIANAGIGPQIRVRDLTWERAAPTLKLNILGSIATLTSALPRMLERGRGHLVGVSSLAGMRGLPSSAVYSASKAALSTFLESLRVDLNGTGVYVTDLRPGFVATDAHRDHAPPFLMTTERCVREMIDAIGAKRGVAMFPKPLAWALGFSYALPNALYDRVISRGPRRRKT